MFYLKPYVLLKTNFSLKFGHMICLRLKYIAIEKLCEIKALRVLYIAIVFNSDVS
jgi:hypothetical protein